jgi:transcriptional regulator with XRE-family HTH domain
MPKTVNTKAQLHLQALLKAARIRAALPQEELARRIGRPQSFIAKYERGERRLDVVEFLVITNAIGTDPRRLIADIIKRGIPQGI